MMLRVVSTASWLSRELSNQDVIEVVDDMGFWLPDDAEQFAWWCPTKYAARLAASGVPLGLRMTGNLEAQGGFAPEVMGRRISVTTADELRGSDEWFIKPLDAKIPSLPATVSTPDNYRETVLAAGFDLGLPVIVSDVVELVSEYRCHIADGRVLACSAYLVEGSTWDAWDEADLPPTAEARAYAQDVVDSARSAFPAGYTLDIGFTAAGRWTVVETNPAWSSGPYWSSLLAPEEVVTSILASQRPGDEGGTGLYVPAVHPAQPLPRKAA